VKTALYGDTKCPEEMGDAYEKLEPDSLSTGYLL